jgi:hypothetical protein
MREPAPRALGHTDMTGVAIVSLGRSGAMGEVRRVASWRLLFEAAGAQVTEILLTSGHRPHFDGIVGITRGRATPERLAWSGRRLRADLAAVRPDLVVVVSARAYDHVATAGDWGVVVDLVDDLERSYRDRADLATSPLTRRGYQVLATAHRRVGRRLCDGRVHTVVAGWRDARQLDAEWIPIVCNPALRPISGIAPDRDVLFFGTLRYAPNVDALERLGRMWPTVLNARPATTALVAGSAPTARVRELCATHGWELVADFASLPEVAARARLAVAPLDRTAGIQIKVLDAASLGMPQVVTTAALEGYAPDFPLTPHDDDSAFAAEIVRLLQDPQLTARQAHETRHHVHETYSVGAWQHQAAGLLPDPAQVGG